VSPFERWSVWTTSALTALTGVVYAWMKYLLTVEDPFAVVNHPLQPLVLKLHILVAPLLVFALGVIAVRHVWRHYQARVRTGRRSGILTGLVVVPMVFTGYLIQAVTQATLLEVIVWTHVGTGLVYAVGAVAHHLVLRRPRWKQLPESVSRHDGQTFRRSDVKREASDGSAVKT
jgi:hypothetical protein